MRWVTPATFQGDYIDPMTGERLAAPIPWWLDHPRPPAPAPSAPAVTPADAAPTPRLPGGWTSAFGYVSPTNWPA